MGYDEKEVNGPWAKEGICKIRATMGSIPVNRATMHDNVLVVGTGAISDFDLGVSIRFADNFNTLCGDFASCESVS